MLISNLINNNYVAAVDDEGNEVIVKGVGIGYKVGRGSYIPDDKIEKIYRINNENTIQKLKGLLQNISEEHFWVCGDIIDYAQKKLQTDLNPNLYVTLTDHINYAIFRLSKGIDLTNPMINEIRIFYPEEFEIGKVVSRMLRGKEVIIHGDGQSVWASTHADDFAQYFCKLVGDESAIGEIYQIMNPEPHTWDMIYQDMAKLLNVEYKPVYIGTDLLRMSKTYNMEESIQGDKRWSNIFDISKISSNNRGYTCQISYKEGLRMYLEYMEEHPELKIEEPEFDEWCDRVIGMYREAKAIFSDRI